MIVVTKNEPRINMSNLLQTISIQSENEQTPMTNGEMTSLYKRHGSNFTSNLHPRSRLSRSSTMSANIDPSKLYIIKDNNDITNFKNISFLDRPGRYYDATALEKALIPIHSKFVKY